jgi:hypothetical protein
MYFKYNDKEIFTGKDMMNKVYKRIGKDQEELVLMIYIHKIDIEEDKECYKLKQDGKV